MILLFVIMSVYSTWPFRRIHRRISPTHSAIFLCKKYKLMYTPNLHNEQARCTISTTWWCEHVAGTRWRRRSTSSRNSSPYAAATRALHPGEYLGESLGEYLGRISVSTLGEYLGEYRAVTRRRSTRSTRRSLNYRSSRERASYTAATQVTAR